ncbi:uncharacterized protein LOC133850324 [Drosophila sulfurigaster albostrigata]|uniref:uncharacterized protein LOC133850324 n=1 Tax=Drosophila sulfurigaster albostrigata TaxID=89887 RepID=UPI002D21AD1E|nr:uncharacterized protein LOC133850324 [Drosophila sulfurigaster albostrigata]
MDFSGPMHQQYLKDFIHSLQSGSEDSHSLSESSLNPNAAEFVPSYMKCNEEFAPCKVASCPAKKGDELTTSTTTLVKEEVIGDAQHNTRQEVQCRIQRQLFHLMGEIGNLDIPIEAMQFSLIPNAQGINVQILIPSRSSRLQFDEKLCQASASGLFVEIGQQGTLAKAGHPLAIQFLNSMCETLKRDSKYPTQAKEPTICPRCTALPKKNSYTELEIERQIEDIKAFERLIKDDGGTRYQEAFKELCNKLGLTTPEEQLLNSGIAAAVPAEQPKTDVCVDQSKLSPNEDEDESYDWDSFTPDFDPMQIYRLTAGENDTHMQLNEAQQEQICSTNNNDQLNQPPSMPAMSITTTATTTNLSSAYPKLYKVSAQMKNSNLQPRKTILHKEKESKLQRYRYSSPVRNGLTTSTMTKKLPEPLYVSGSRAKTLPAKTGIVKSELAGSQIFKTPNKVAKHQPDIKHNKAATLERSLASGTVQTPSPKQSAATATSAPRVVVPRSTHASQMRQSEVKRRLSLMRGDDSDVQFNEYLFK